MKINRIGKARIDALKDLEFEEVIENGYYSGNRDTSHCCKTGCESKAEKDNFFCLKHSFEYYFPYWNGFRQYGEYAFSRLEMIEDAS